MERSFALPWGALFGGCAWPARSFAAGNRSGSWLTPMHCSARNPVGIPTTRPKWWSFITIIEQLKVNTLRYIRMNDCYCMYACALWPHCIHWVHSFFTPLVLVPQPYPTTPSCPCKLRFVVATIAQMFQPGNGFTSRDGVGGIEHTIVGGEVQLNFCEELKHFGSCSLFSLQQQVLSLLVKKFGYFVSSKTSLTKCWWVVRHHLDRPAFLEDHKTGHNNSTDASWHWFRDTLSWF